MENKHAYLLVTDLHFNFQKDGRLNYLGEVLDVFVKLIDIKTKYSNLGYECTLILLGDVVDNSIPNSERAMQAIEILRFLTSNFKDTYAVVGNHELTYFKDNPFWFLVADIEDSSLSRIKRMIQPQGLSSVIKVPATLIDGEVTFYFNHYGITPKIPSAKGINIGLFHTNIGNNELCKMWGAYDDPEEVAYVKGYDYCFFAHVHKAQGKYFLNNAKTCIGEWLGTLGRTNIGEFDTVTQVNVPVVLIHDGKFNSIEPNTIELKTAKECIDYPKVEANKKARELVKARKDVAVNSFVGTTLLEMLKNSIVDEQLAGLLQLCQQHQGTVLLEYQRCLDLCDISLTNLEEQAEEELTQHG